MNSPLIQSLQLEGFDPGRMVSAVQGGMLEHTQLAPGHFQGTVLHAGHGETAVDFGAYNLPVLAEGPFTRDAVTLGFVLHESGVAKFNGRALLPWTMVTYTEGHELVASLPENSAWASIQLSRETLSQMGWECPAVGFGARALKGNQQSRVRNAVLAPLAQLRIAVSTPSGARGVPGAFLLSSIHEIENIAVTALFKTFPQTVRTFGRSPAAGRSTLYRLSRRVSAYMTDRLSDPLRIADICKDNNCTYKVLEHAFRRAYGVSPKHYLNLRRLNRLRHLLLHDSTVSSVSEASLRCGLTHFGRTSLIYRQVFGELPSDTFRADPAR